MPAQSSSIPPKLPTRPALGLFVAVLVTFAGIAAAAVLFFFDPTKNNFYPACQFHQLTGFYCPGCGATRATYQLLHGNFLLAVHDNVLYLIALVVLALRGLWYGKQKLFHQRAGPFVSPAALWIFLVACLVFGVLRNVPAFSFLAPIPATP